MVTAILLSLATIAFGATPWDDIPPGFISFRTIGKCGNGEPAGYGFVQPSKLVHPDKFWIVVMGGAVCFNKGSCLNFDIGATTMGIRYYMKHRMGMDDITIKTMAGGVNIPLAMMAGMAPGYLPFDESHPRAGQRGVFFLSCTGDINMGRRDVTYTDGYTNEDKGTCDETERGVANEGYRGCQNQSQSGLPCQKWTSQTPNEHKMNASRTDLGLGDHNYCRNPDGEPTIWCYTVAAPSSRWEECLPKGKAIGPISALHHGGKNMYDALNIVKKHYPRFSDVAIWGGSGGGVSAAAWAPMIADFWPMAKVVGFVDSGMHVFPGTDLFQYFYDMAMWGPGPVGQGDGLYSDVPVPDFDWRESDAVAAHVASFDGRVKIAYLSCIDDHQVFGDRGIMLYYANRSAYESLTKARQRKDTWQFLANLEKCAPAGTAFSYIQNCSKHFQTWEKEWEPSVPPGDVTPKMFVERFLKGLPPNPNNDKQTEFWYQTSPHTEDVTCSSPVRRRRTWVQEEETSSSTTGNKGGSTGTTVGSTTSGSSTGIATLTVTYSGSLTVKVDASATQVQMAVKKSIEIEFAVSSVIVTATESRRLDQSGATPRQLVGNFDITFTIVAPAAKSAAILTKATSLSGNTADLQDQMRAQLKAAGASDSAVNAMTVASFSVVETTTGTEVAVNLTSRAAVSAWLAGFLVLLSLK